MAVDFTPNRGEYKELTPFRYWCQKVLPLVYDDSISYYELLCKVVNYLNITMEDVSTLNDDVTAVYTAYSQLQQYVNSYFDNLDVQQEINTKLDEMVTDGTMSRLIEPFVTSQIGDVVADQIGETVAGQIGDTVAGQIGGVVATQLPAVADPKVRSYTNAWLAANITQPTTPVIDKTLTVENQAAEAKAAGIKFAELANIDGLNPVTGWQYDTYPSFELDVDTGAVIGFNNVYATLTGAKTTLIGVSPGQTFLLFTRGITQAPSYIFMHSSAGAFHYEPIEGHDWRVEFNKTYTALVITVPENADTLIITTAEIRLDSFVVNPDYATGLWQQIANLKTGLWQQIANLKADLSGITENELIPITETGWITTNVGIGNTVSETVTASSTMLHVIVNCSGGDEFTITCHSGSSARAWCFVDSNSKALSFAGDSVTCNNDVIIAPPTATKLICNFVKAQEHRLTKGNNLQRGISLKTDEPFVLNNGTRINVSGTYNDGVNTDGIAYNSASAAIPVSKGDSFKITLNGGTLRGLTFIDSQKKIKMTSSGASFNGLDVVAPVSGYLIVNTSNTDEYKVLKYKNPVGKPIPLDIVDHYYLHYADGLIRSDSTSCSTRFIKVKPNTKYLATNLRGVGNRGICEYDRTMTLVNGIQPSVDGFDTGSMCIFTTKATTEYIRMCGVAGFPPTLTEYSIDADMIEDYENTSVIDLKRSNAAHGMITCSLESTGKYIVTELSSNSNYLTDYIPVEENRSIRLCNFLLVNRLLYVLYDAGKDPIGRGRLEEDSRTVTYWDLKTPYKCAYIRFVCNSNQLDQYDILYTDNEDTQSVDEFYPYVYNKELFNTIKSKAPMCVLIDDDTQGIGYVQAFHERCVANGIAGNYAVVTKNLDNSAELAETLQDYEAEGFGMLYHCDEQLPCYRGTSYPERNLAEAESNFVAGLRKMRTYGFLDYHWWVVPYGTIDDDMVAIGQRHGMKACMSAANATYVTTSKRNNRWKIPRCALNVNDAASPTGYTMASLKADMDNCYSEHGLLFITTHMNDGWTINNGELDAAGKARFDEAIQYALSLGYKFVTLPEAMIYWMPMYQLNEMM